METPGPFPFQIANCHRPGQAMAPFPFKLPAEVVAELQSVADQLGKSRTALGRHYLM